MNLAHICPKGTLEEVKEIVEGLDDSVLADQLALSSGPYGYTLLHEAVASEKPEVLDYLLTRTRSAGVDRRAKNGYTPLHLAASRGSVECVRVLLRHGADIFRNDTFGKTPSKVAESISIFRPVRSRILKLLRNEEVIMESATDRLMELLKSTDASEPSFLNRALMAATRNDNHLNIGELVFKGAQNIDECLAYAQRDNKPLACAMLLLIKAASSGNTSTVNKLFGGTVNEPDCSKYFDDSSFYDVQSAILRGEVSTMVPIEIARRNGHLRLQEELLLKTHVNLKKGHVYWHGLRLRTIEVSWLRRISWVKVLILAKNGLTVFPGDIKWYLQKVVSVHLQYNELSCIPRCLLELPSLQELILSHNKLTSIPDSPQWSKYLTLLDLSFNQLSTMPINVVAPVIHSLNLSHNAFRTVPLCICSFVTLHSLNLSDNPGIKTLPAEMGRLWKLDQLYLNNMKSLRNPPKKLRKDPRDCIRYLNSKLRCAKGFYHMKLMLVGYANRGKTTLVKRLQGKPYGNESTVGVDISEWCLKPTRGKNPFYFSIWDFGGQQEYYATHQCFLSQRSLYLLLFNLTDGEAGVQELKPWLNNIALRAPRSVVIIIGTHLDTVPDYYREKCDYVLNSVGVLAETYHTLQIVEVMPVGLKNRIENIGLLKEAIYNHAANYKTKAGQHIMGQKIPASYHALDKQLEVVQQEVRQGLREPIMHSEEFNTMVQQMNLADIQGAEDLKMATLFLGDVGSLLHYDDRSHNLHELYFVDPCWLCDVMYKVVTIKERNPFVKKGILYSKDIPMLLKNDTFPWKYFEQFLTLLDRFEIALPLDNRRVLIPSMLPEERPKHLTSETDKNLLIYSRYILFNSTKVPPGFWSRLLSRIMHSIPQISFALDKTTPSTLLSESPDSQELYSAPQLLPNFPSSLPIAMQDSYDVKEIQLDYWRTGLYYNDHEPLMFRIESLAKSNQSRWKGKDGVLIIASPNNQGKKIIGQMVDLVISLIQEWYPGLAEGHHSSNNLEQRVPCFECLKAGRKYPFEFKVECCLDVISHSTMKCRYYKDDAKNHIIALSDVVPDLLFEDGLLLNANEIYYQEDDTHLLGKGNYAKVYKGRSHNQIVAIKKFINRSTGAFSELRSEAKLLQQSHHPCIIQLIGVCVHPFMALVLEEAPLNSLEFSLLKKKIPVHRLTLFRIAAEVAAALRYLHGQEIIFRDLKAANVLLWSLDPSSLCHCKVTDFGIATHMAPTGSRGLQGTKGFIAPEVLHISKRKQRSGYDHKADIFSFGMFLYQIISRRHPYHDIAPDHVDVSVWAGNRPKLHDVDISKTGYHYLTILMKKCWEDNPKHRPDTEEIIKTVCIAPMQSVMCVHPIQSNFSLCHATALTPIFCVESNKLQNELWVCCDGAEGAELNIYNSHNMVNTSKLLIKDNQVQCMALCNDHIWVGSRAGIEHGIIDIFNIATHELVHNIRMREISISCLTAAKDKVLIGTLEDNLALESFICREEEQDALIGHLSNSSDDQFIWSAHIDGILLTAWDAHNHVLCFDIDTCKMLQKIDNHTSVHDSLITAMIPALDTVWVGMATGHILVFHKEELLTWYRPYQDYVRFLSLIPGSGPCEMEKCMVVSGGKAFQPLVKDMGPDYEKLDEKGQPLDKSGVLVIWEAYEAKTMCQIKLVQERSPNHLDTHNTVRQMIHDGEFKDGTHIKVVHTGETAICQDISPSSPDLDAQPNLDYLSASLHKSQTEFTITPSYNHTDSLRAHTQDIFTNTSKVTSEDDEEGDEIESGAFESVGEYEMEGEAEESDKDMEINKKPIITVTQPCKENEVFEIELPGPDPDSTQVVCVKCPKPPQLKVLLSELQINSSLPESECCLAFHRHPLETVILHSQEDLDAYLALPIKPKLCLVMADDH